MFAVYFMYFQTSPNKDHVAKLVQHQLTDLGMQVQILSWSIFLLNIKVASK